MSEKPLSIEHAGNKLAAMKDQDFREEAKKLPFQPSVDNAASRMKYLRYVLGLVPNRTVGNFRGMEVHGKHLKAILTMRINGASIKIIADTYKVPVKLAEQLEKYCMMKMMDIISATQATRIPLVGGG